MATLNKVSDLGDYLREQRHGAKLTLRQLADAAGVSNPYLSQVERGLRKPSAEMLGQIAKGLRISAETLYVRAGILAERGDRIEVQAAVLADPHLNERQRQVLLDIYETFRTENERDGVPTSGVPAPRKRSAAKRTTPKTTRKTGAKKAPAPRNRAPRGGN
ncbi:MAG TPA: helix-turn-helix transcriptional regulator [Actinomycetales bacterium]|nr:helix-turn-helix transcriptional regulator [Actinomycetales bacterium]